MIPTPYQWRGPLKRGTVPGTVVGEIRDPAGFVIVITGTLVSGGYDLVGLPGPIPEELSLPGDEDGPAPPRPALDTTPAKRIPAPKPGQSKMLGNYCPDCSALHEPPACGHDQAKPCPGCGKPFGGLTPRMTTRDVCWRCERARGGET